MIIYMSMISILGVAAVVVSLWDKFAQPQYRPLRAGIFIAMGLSSKLRHDVVCLLYLIRVKCYAFFEMVKCADKS